ncbi:uncharacterized protein LOC127799677 [Diospyros lotus]|uniref:uncharacterized protein LOC127799677 n=1 Tax=Diospyros lotus TaxID=55363 RepID=UPI0022577871|nr:uncharacterized protein LOC127799677 [Diospyros lotus]
MREMVSDIVLQVGLMLLLAFIFLLMHNIPQKALSYLQTLRSRSQTQAKRHFVRGAQLLSQAQALAAKDQTAAAFSLAKSAADEADRAISLDAKDAAAHILKALAFEIQGYRTSALDSLDAALSPMAARSLTKEERSDALLKRAELKVALGAKERVDSAIADLVESVRLKDDNAKAYIVLGECYEMKGMAEAARKAYEDALRVEPRAAVAREAVERLGSS